MDKIILVDYVIRQIEEDIEDEDTDALAELLEFLPTEILERYLRWETE